MKALNVRGVSIAVINKYEIEWTKGYGFADLESKRRPVEVTTLFQAGSISKPVAAVAAMKLVEQGKLALDQDINTFLKTWKLPDNNFTKEKKMELAIGGGHPWTIRAQAERSCFGAIAAELSGH